MVNKGVTRSVRTGDPLEQHPGEFMSDEVADKNDLPIPVILDFVPTSCSIQLNQYPDNSAAPSISMRLRLSGRDNVTTPEERSLNNIEWSISIARGPVSNEHVQALGAIGMLNYYTATEDVDYSIEEGGSAWAHLEHEPFSLLSKFVMSGRLPSSVRIHAQGGGLRYGWEPDGSGKVWDVKANKNAPVKQLEISLGIVGQSEDEEAVTEIHRPVAADDLHNLERSLSAAFGTSLNRINSRLGWILLVAVLVAVVVLLQ